MGTGVNFIMKTHHI